VVCELSKFGIVLLDIFRGRLQVCVPICVFLFSRNFRFKVAVPIRLFPYTISRTTEPNFINFAVRELYVILSSHVSVLGKIGQVLWTLQRKSKRFSTHHRRILSHQFSYANIEFWYTYVSTRKTEDIPYPVSLISRFFWF
jgi:hypothetical protein